MGQRAMASLVGVEVLLVEDDDDTREVLRLGLELYGATVRDVPTTAQALRAMGEGKPDVVVSDVGLPDEDGYELIRRIRLMPKEQGGDVPALAVTAYTLGDDTRRALAAGFHAHLAKPVDTRVLIDAVSRLARRSTAAGSADKRRGERRRVQSQVAFDRRNRERRATAATAY